jgi:hypothetical protein
MYFISDCYTILYRRKRTKKFVKNTAMALVNGTLSKATFFAVVGTMFDVKVGDCCKNICAEEPYSEKIGLTVEERSHILMKAFHEVYPNFYKNTPAPRPRPPSPQVQLLQPQLHS